VVLFNFACFQPRVCSTFYFTPSAQVADVSTFETSLHYSLELACSVPCDQQYPALVPKMVGVYFHVYHCIHIYAPPPSRKNPGDLKASIIKLFNLHFELQKFFSWKLPVKLFKHLLVQTATIKSGDLFGGKFKRLPVSHGILVSLTLLHYGHLALNFQTIFFPVQIAKFLPL
jgi:hypothetical protein